ncbi:hypothetical protein J7J13_04260 [bacterium]|nr:hypothetical protein [bacterium]
MKCGIAEASESVKIGVITDIHKCSAKKNNSITAELINKFNSSVNLEATDFNVDLGDNISHRVNKCSHTAKDDLKWVVEKLNTTSPLYHVLSDHDINNRKSFSYWKKKTGTLKTYHSFDVKNVHIVILDTITGGGKIYRKCDKDAKCKKYKRKYEKYKSLLRNDEELGEYLQQKNITEKKLSKRKKRYKKLYQKRKHKINKTRTAKNWDRGNLNNKQLKWLKNDLENTPLNKIILFSDHPLFYFQKPHKGKKYNIRNRAKLDKILYNSEKDIVSISGEAHLWHQTTINNVAYYIIDDFLSANGTWAIFEWNDAGFNLRKISN